MKRIPITVLFLFFLSSVHSQQKKEISFCGGIHAVEEPIKNDNRKTTLSQRNGFTSENRFYLDFVGTPSEDFEDVVRQVFNDIEELINFQTSNCYTGDNLHTVRILIDVDNLSGTTLAQAGVYFVNKDDGKRRTSVLWDKINNQYDHNSRNQGLTVIFPFFSNYDARITFDIDSLNDFYIGYNTTIPSDKFDLYTITLHEVIHLLGFGSLVSHRNFNDFSPTSVLDFFSLYDAYIYNQNQELINYNSTIEQWDYAITDPFLIRDDCPNIRFKTNVDDYSVYSSTTLGFSTPLAHFESGCNGSPDYVMNASITTGVHKDLTQDEANTIRALGYTLNNTFGTSNLEVGGANPRQIALSGGMGIVAYEDASENYTYTLGSSPLTIPLNELLQNDIFNGGAEVFGVASDSDNVTVTTDASNLYFSATDAETKLLRYYIKDNQGYISNYAKIIINVKEPDNSIFNGSYDNECNLVSNSELNGVFSSTGLFDEIDGWRPMVGTPDFLSTSLNTGSGSFRMISGENSNNLPVDGLGHYNQEGVMTNITIEAGKKYILNYFDQRVYNATTGNARVEIGLGDYQEIRCQFNIFNNSGYAYENTNVIPNRFIIDQHNVYYWWRQNAISFTADDDYNILYFQGIGGNGSNGTYIDNIELIEDKMSTMQTSYEYSCESPTLTIGEELCAVTGMYYEWWDVTGGTETLLTQKNTIISAVDNSGNPIGLVVGDVNGTQLITSPTSNAVYELRRKSERTTFDTGTPIYENNIPDEVQQITVNYDCSCPLSNTYSWRIDAIDSNWNNTANWEGAIVPLNDNESIAFIPSGANNYPIIDSLVEIGFLLLEENATLQISANSTLTVNCRAVVKDNALVTIQDKGSFILWADRPIEFEGSGKFKVFRNSPDYVAQYYYSYWSSPIQESDALVNDIFGSTIQNGHAFQFGADQNPQVWQYINPSTQYMEQARGYALRHIEPISSGDTFSYTAEYNGEANNGSITSTIYNYPSSDTTSDPGQNLLGNPYPSALSWNLIVTDTDNANLDGTVYLWEHKTGSGAINYASDYVYYNLLGGVPASTTGNIASCQGMFVAAFPNNLPLNTSGDITFKNEHRVIENNNIFYRSSDVTSTTNRIWLNFKDSNNLYQTTLTGFTPEATSDRDRLYDGLYQFNYSGLEFYQVGGDHKYVIQGLPILEESTVVDLGISVSNNDSYSFSIDQEYIDPNYSIYLFDSELNTYINLRVQDYSVELNENTQTDSRFKLVFQKSDANVVYVDDTATGNNDGTSWINAFNNLQDALDLTRRNSVKTKIFVAEGIYHPSVVDNINHSFKLVDGVELYGGFANGGAVFENRNSVLYKTILSGEIGTLERNDNTKIIVKADNNRDSINLIDGFIIENAQNFGLQSRTTTSSNTLNIKNTVFQDNYKINERGNSKQGGAIKLIGNLESQQNITTIDACVFKQNGLAITANKNNKSTIVNSLFVENEGKIYGGIVLNHKDKLLFDVEIINCTFYNNLKSIRYGLGDLEIVNTILWSTLGLQTINSTNSASMERASISHSILSDVDVCEDINCLDALQFEVNPLFISPSSEDFNLKEDSPAIDTGNQTDAPNQDINQTNRPLGDGIDIGAYESKYNAASVLFNRGSINSLAFYDTDENYELEEKMNIVVYPNPSSGKIKIQFKGEQKIILIEVINLLGGNVLSVNKNEINENQQELDLSSLDSGLYMLRFSFDDNLTVVKKVVIRK